MNNIKYVISVAMALVGFFLSVVSSLIGINEVVKVDTFLGFILMVITLLFITFASCLMVVELKEKYKGGDL